MRGFVRGFTAPGRALAMLRRERDLRRYVYLPVLVNVVVGVVLYGLLLVAGLGAIDDLIARVDFGAAILEAILQVLLIVALLVAISFVLVRFGVVLGAPWYGRLSEEIEARRGVDRPDPAGTGLGRVARELGRAVRFEAQKLLLVIAIGLPLLALNLVPVAGQIAAVIGGSALGALVACLDFFDGPLERRRRGFGQKLGFVRRALPASAGFGLVCALLLAVPALNLVSIPVCVTAGTLLWTELTDDPRDPELRDPRDHRAH